MPKKCCKSKYVGIRPPKVETVKCTKIPLPETDAQWILLAFLLTICTAMALAPPSYLARQIVFAPPSSADLLLPARNPTAHLERAYRTAVIARVAEIAPMHCNERSVLFAQNFIMRAGEGDEMVVDADLVHICSDSGGETMVGLRFEPLGSKKITCAEEYGNEFHERVRNAVGMIEYAAVENGDYRRVRRATRSPAEACVVQHAIEITDGTWQQKSGI